MWYPLNSGSVSVPQLLGEKKKEKKERQLGIIRKHGTLKIQDWMKKRKQLKNYNSYCVNSIVALRPKVQTVLSTAFAGADAESYIDYLNNKKGTHKFIEPRKVRNFSFS